MLWSPGRRQPIPKYCLTLTHVENSPKSLPSRKLVLKYKYVGFLHITDICAEACLLAHGWVPERPLGLTKLPSPSHNLTQCFPHRSPTVFPPCPVWSGFYQQSMLQLIGKLASHMLSICFVFLDLQDVPDQISFRWNAFGWVYPACFSRKIRAAAQSMAETCTKCRSTPQSKGEFLKVYCIKVLKYIAV